MRYLRAIRETWNMMGTVEFTFRGIKPIDFLLRLAGPRNRDRARTKTFHGEQMREVASPRYLRWFIEAKIPEH